MKVLANGLTFLKLTSSTPSYSLPFWFYPCQFQRQYWWHRRQAFRRDGSAWKLACVAWRLVQDTRDTRDHGRPLAIAFSFACLSYHVFRFVSAKSRCEEVIWAWKSEKVFLCCDLNYIVEAMPSGRIRCYQRFSTFNFIRFKLLRTVSSRDQTTVAPQKGGGMNNKLKS